MLKKVSDNSDTGTNSVASDGGSLIDQLKVFPIIDSILMNQ
jgi:hypothetical protein